MYAIATSGGKDSTFALWRAGQEGMSVTHVFHLYGTEYERVRFHGYRPRMIELQAEALGLKAIIEPTRSDQFDDDFSAALRKVKEAGLSGVIFGNLHLEDVQQFYRERVEAAGLEYRDVLWGRDPALSLREFISEGFRAVVVSVWLKLLDGAFLGRELDERFAGDLAALDGVDPCGENGEYHTLAYDGPCFAAPLRFTTHGAHETENNVFLDIRPA